MSYFEKNMEALEKKQPELAELMRQEIDCSHIEIFTSETGTPTARVTTHQGTKVILHDLKDPITRAQEHLKQFELIGNNGTVLLGFGLGYLALEIVNTMADGHLLLVCESDPALFKAALEQVDLAPLLKSEQVKILLGKDVDITASITTLAIKLLTSKISVIKYHPSCSIDPETYASLEKKAQETALTLKVNANTILYAGREMAGNILENTPEIMRSPGVKYLFNKFKNIPAIIVGAGPSLDKNVALLKEVKDRAVIIAVDRTLGLLLPLGITPHLVPSIDYSKVNYDEKFSHFQSEEDFFLVFSQTLHHKITKTFWGPKFTMNMDGKLNHALGYYWGDKGGVSTGLHVGHLSFCLAKALGCNPIIMTGMDLAFTEDKIHAEDIETAEQYASSEYYASESIFGESLKSDSSFRSFVISINREIEQTQALCIDATEGGAKKDGTTIMRLRDAIDEYCNDNHPEIRRILEEESSKDTPVHSEELVRDLLYARDAAREMKKASEATLKLIKKLRKMKRDGQEGTPEYSNLTHKAEKMTVKMGGEGRIISMLENYNFANILFMGKDAVKRIDEISSPFEKLDKQLDRAEIYYKNLTKALIPFYKDVQQLLKRLTLNEKAQATLRQSKKNWSNYFTCALSLMACENYADAETALKRAIDLKPDCHDAYLSLGEIYYRQNRYKTAITVLQQALAINSSLSKANNLLKKCQGMNQLWEERCAKIRDKFLKDTSYARDEIELLLEAGSFYFRVKDYKRAEQEFTEVVQKHPDLSEAHYHLGHTYFAMKDFAKGVESLSTALELSPDNPAIYRDLGLVSIDRGLVEAAEKLLLKALELKPDDLEIKETLGNIYFNNGLFDKAVKFYEDILSINPAHKDLTKNLGVAYQKLINKNLQLPEAEVNR